MCSDYHYCHTVPTSTVTLYLSLLSHCTYHYCHTVPVTVTSHYCHTVTLYLTQLPLTTVTLYLTQLPLTTVTLYLTQLPLTTVTLYLSQLPLTTVTLSHCTYHSYLSLLPHCHNVSITVTSHYCHTVPNTVTSHYCLTVPITVTCHTVTLYLSQLPLTTATLSQCTYHSYLSHCHTVPITVTSHTQHINTLCEQNAATLVFSPTPHNYTWTLNGQTSLTNTSGWALSNCTTVLTEMVNIYVRQADRQHIHINKACAVQPMTHKYEFCNFVCQTCKTEGGSHVGWGGGESLVILRSLRVLLPGTERKTEIQRGRKIKFANRKWQQQYGS